MLVMQVTPTSPKPDIFSTVLHGSRSSYAATWQAFLSSGILTGDLLASFLCLVLDYRY